MKNQQRREAQSLYLNAGLTKTQIADQLSISRRTVYQWSLEGDWDKLRKSAQHMPAILAEKCYYLIGHFADHLLSAESQDKLTITANKLKQGTTVSEAMQTFTILLGRIQCHDPALAEMVAPHIQSFVHDRRKLSETEFLLSGFSEDGYLDQREEDPTEQELDQQDLAALLADRNATNTNTSQQTAHPAAQPKPSQPQTTSPRTKPPTPQPKQSFRDRNKSLYSPSFGRHSLGDGGSALQTHAPLVVAA